MNLTLAKIINKIREEKLPNWKLSLKQGYAKPIPFAHNDFIPTKKAEASEEEEINSKELEKAIELSVKQLEGAVAYYSDSPGVLFEIELSKQKRNGGAIIGPLVFAIGDTAGQTARQEAIPGLAGFNGLGALESIFDKKMEVHTAYNALELQKVMFAAEKDTQLKDLDRQRSELAKKIEEVEELKKKYESNSERVKYGMVKYFEDKLTLLFPDQEPESSLKGVETETKELPASEEQKLVESIAANIFENVKDKNELLVIGVVVTAFIKDPTAPMFQEYREKLNRIKQ